MKKIQNKKIGRILSRCKKRLELLNPNLLSEFGNGMLPKNGSIMNRVVNDNTLEGKIEKAECEDEGK